MNTEKEKFIAIKKDVVQAYIKLFGEEKGRTLLNKLKAEKERIWEEQHRQENITVNSEVGRKVNNE